MGLFVQSDGGFKNTFFVLHIMPQQLGLLHQQVSPLYVLLTF